MKEKEYILDGWFALIQEVRDEKESITPFALADKLMNWISSTKRKYDNESIDKLYDAYISHYINLNQSDYIFDKLWYDFDELLEYDLIKPRPQSISRIFEITNFILNEIYTFRTTIECPHCDNEYRAHMDQDFNLYLYCEQCNYYKDHNESMLADKKLVPASSEVIKKHNLSSYCPR